jgi:hypothetical protein
MDNAIEYLGKRARYGKNEHHLRVSPDVPDKALIQYVIATNRDHDSFGAYVQRGDGEAYVFFYTD